jgi:AcrR family transcriptional regulator
MTLMAQPASKPTTRQVRRRQQTRAALIAAAQACIAAGRTNVPVFEITQAADVGIGSFYNHFSSKDELFQAAVNDALDAHGALLDAIVRTLDDPAEVFAASFRLTGRLFRLCPQESRILLHGGMSLISSDRGLAPRAARDIATAAEAGRFHVPDLELAVAMAAGSLMALGQLLLDQPGRDDGEAADRIAENMLRLFGLPTDEAREICSRPLPELGGFLSALAVPKTGAEALL